MFCLVTQAPTEAPLPDRPDNRLVYASSSRLGQPNRRYNGLHSGSGHSAGCLGELPP